MHRAFKSALGKSDFTWELQCIKTLPDEPCNRADTWKIISIKRVAVASVFLKYRYQVMSKLQNRLKVSQFVNKSDFFYTRKTIAGGLFTNTTSVSQWLHPLPKTLLT